MMEFKKYDLWNPKWNFIWNYDRIYEIRELISMIIPLLYCIVFYNFIHEIEKPNNGIYIKTRILEFHISVYGIP